MQANPLSLCTRPSESPSPSACVMSGSGASTPSGVSHSSPHSVTPGPPTPQSSGNPGTPLNGSSSTSSLFQQNGISQLNGKHLSAKHFINASLGTISPVSNASLINGINLGSSNSANVAAAAAVAAAVAASKLQQRQVARSGISVPTSIQNSVFNHNGSSSLAGVNSNVILNQAVSQAANSTPGAIVMSSIQPHSGPGRRSANSGKGAFLCPVCNKTFTQKGNLKTHMLIHTGEKPYSCSVCGKAFTQKGNVDTHMKIHTQPPKSKSPGQKTPRVRDPNREKPFVCGICNKCFSQKGNLTAHLRTHNKDERYPCIVCGKSFTQKGNLKTHMQRHSPTELEAAAARQQQAVAVSVVTSVGNSLVSSAAQNGLSLTTSVANSSINPTSTAAAAAGLVSSLTGVANGQSQSAANVSAAAALLDGRLLGSHHPLMNSFGLGDTQENQLHGRHSPLKLTNAMKQQAQQTQSQQNQAFSLGQANSHPAHRNSLMTASQLMSGTDGGAQMAFTSGNGVPLAAHSSSGWLNVAGNDERAAAIAAAVVAASNDAAKQAFQTNECQPFALGGYTGFGQPLQQQQQMHSSQSSLSRLQLLEHLNQNGRCSPAQNLTSGHPSAQLQLHQSHPTSQHLQQHYNSREYGRILQ